MKTVVLPAKFIDDLDHPVANRHGITKAELEAMKVGRMTMLYANHYGESSKRWRQDHIWEGTAILQPIAYDKAIAKHNKIIT